MIDYDPHDWRSHLLDIRGSMVREIATRVLATVMIAVLVTAIHLWVIPLSVSPLAHTLVGFSLGLLLVFRTNSAYDRFWEARRIWGSIVNTTRDLCRLANEHLRRDESRKSFLSWLSLFPWATEQQLRGKPDWRVWQTRLSPADLAKVREARHRPFAVARAMTAIVAQERDSGGLVDLWAIELDRRIGTLVDLVGGCERIHSTPLPYAYVVHLRRALIAYCGTAPFAMVESLGGWTILATFLISYIFFGIEEIGVETEDPFDDDANSLPLERFCANLDENLNEIQGSGSRA